MRAFGYALFVIVLDLLVIGAIYVTAEQRSAAEEAANQDADQSAFLKDPTPGIPIDPKTQLIMGDGFSVVRVECVKCHPTQIIRSFHADRSRWTDTIRWMQREKGLRRFEPAIEESIVTYLTTYYGN